MNIIDKHLKPFIKKGLIFHVPEERSFLYRNLSKFAKNVKNKRVLDIGAGDRRYAHMFIENNHYESSDIADSFHPEYKHDIIASVYDIPKEDYTYDVVLLLQVLEHLEFPVRGLTEINRILKDEGLLFLSVPQAAGDHFEPYHFFNFTQFGLKSVLSQAGFTIKEHYRLAGMFNYVANRFSKLGSLPLSMSRQKKEWLFRIPAVLFYLMCNWFAYCISLFDFIDRQKSYCIGHIVIAKKK